MQDRIEKQIELQAPVERVWRALTDHREFGTWFRVDLEGPFVVGEVTRGQVTYPGYEHLSWVAKVRTIEPQRVFAFTWCPYSDEADTDSAEQHTTLVEFRLAPTETGTLLSISESGFDNLPDDRRRADAIRLNTQGWDTQCKNIAAHVEA